MNIASADGLIMNKAMNARSERMPPINSHFHARTNPRSPIPNKVNNKIVFKVIVVDVPLLALSIDSPINITKKKLTRITLITRAMMRGIFIEFVEFVFIFLSSVIIVLTPHFKLLICLLNLISYRFFWLHITDSYAHLLLLFYFNNQVDFSLQVCYCSIHAYKSWLSLCLYDPTIPVLF